MTAVGDCVGTAPACIKSGLNTKMMLMVYTIFPVGFIKSTAFRNLICILDWRGLYSVFQELSERKKIKPKNYWIILSHIRSAL